MHRFCSCSSSALAILLAGLGATAAHGQTAPAQSASGAPSEASAVESDDIVVTANKRSESINKVGLSITAATGDTLLAAGVTSPNDLGKVVPGFYFTKSLYGSPVFTMRGIGFNTTALGLTPAVSVYVDEVPLSYPQMTQGATLDIARVEALKGPQGVLFGNNSTGGAINYIAAAPTADLQAGGTLSFARFARVEAEAYVSGPLSDTLRARVALRTEQGGAWQVSQTRPGDKLGDADRLFGRLLFDWTPDSRLSLRFSLNGWRDRSESQARRALAIIPLIPGTVIGLPQNALVPAGLLAVFPPPASGSRAADWDPGRSLRSDSSFFQASLRADYELGDRVKLTSITAYSDLTPRAIADTDGTAFKSVTVTQTGSLRTFFQEVRLDAGLGDRASLLVGLNYEHARSRDSLTAEAGASIYNLFLGQPFGTDDTRSDTDADTYAAFSKFDFKLTDTLKLTAAARYTKDRRRGRLCTFDVGGGIAAIQNIFSGTTLGPGDCITATNGRPGIIHDKLNENNLSWRFGAEWQVTPDALFYATVNRGYKSGGFPNVFAFDASQLRPVVQERLNAYEVGAKLTLLDRLLQFNAALFRYDYRNKQIQGRIIVGPLGALETLVNVPKSRVNGGEVQLSARPAQGLTFSIGASYVDSRIAAGTFAYTPFGDFANVGGEHFPGAPKWQVNADTAIERPINDRLKGIAGASLVYTGKTNSAFGDLPILAVPDYALIDARVGLASASDRWRATLFVRNLTNKTYFYSTQQTIDVLTRYYGQPRTYGVTFQVKY